jgi:pantoate--beta-alanine ligase
VKVFTTILELRSELKVSNDSLAMVPTMGALHAGHLSLVEIARSKADKVIVSIFVNPTQFNSQSDLLHYPRDLQKDLVLLEDAGVEYVFTPSEDEVYRFYNGTIVSPSALGEVMEGPGRPGHFQGVCTVVSILFGVCKPDVAVFGEKDFQQLRIIEDMVNDLKFDVAIMRAPISREESGLARSSRNERLTKDEREKACVIFRALDAGRVLANSGEVSVSAIIDRSREVLQMVPELELEYLSVNRDSDLSLVDLIEAGNRYRIFFAGNLGNVRLIDNLEL